MLKVECSSIGILGIPQCHGCGSYLQRCELCGYLVDNFFFEPCFCKENKRLMCECNLIETTAAVPSSSSSSSNFEKIFPSSDEEDAGSSSDNASEPENDIFKYVKLAMDKRRVDRLEQAKQNKKYKEQMKKVKKFNRHLNEASDYSSDGSVDIVEAMTSAKRTRSNSTGTLLKETESKDTKSTLKSLAMIGIPNKDAVKKDTVEKRYATLVSFKTRDKAYETLFYPWGGIERVLQDYGSMEDFLAQIGFRTFDDFLFKRGGVLDVFIPKESRPIKSFFKNRNGNASGLELRNVISGINGTSDNNIAQTLNDIENNIEYYLKDLDHTVKHGGVLLYEQKYEEINQFIEYNRQYEHLTSLNDLEDKLYDSWNKIIMRDLKSFENKVLEFGYDVQVNKDFNDYIFSHIRGHENYDHYKFVIDEQIFKVKKMIEGTMKKEHVPMENEEKEKQPEHPNPLKNLNEQLDYFVQMNQKLDMLHNKGSETDTNMRDNFLEHAKENPMKTFNEQMEMFLQLLQRMDDVRNRNNGSDVEMRDVQKNMFEQTRDLLSLIDQIRKSDAGNDDCEKKYKKLKKLIKNLGVRRYDRDDYDRDDGNGLQEESNDYQQEAPPQPPQQQGRSVDERQDQQITKLNSDLMGLNTNISQVQNSVNNLGNQFQNAMKSFVEQIVERDNEMDKISSNLNNFIVKIDSNTEYINKLRKYVVVSLKNIEERHGVLAESYDNIIEMIGHLNVEIDKLQKDTDLTLPDSKFSKNLKQIRKNVDDVEGILGTKVGLHDFETRLAPLETARIDLNNTIEKKLSRIVDQYGNNNQSIPQSELLDINKKLQDFSDHLEQNEKNIQGQYDRLKEIEKDLKQHEQEVLGEITNLRTKLDTFDGNLKTQKDKLDKLQGIEERLSDLEIQIKDTVNIGQSGENLNAQDIDKLKRDIMDTLNNKSERKNYNKLESDLKQLIDQNKSSIAEISQEIQNPERTMQIINNILNEKVKNLEQIKEDFKTTEIAITETLTRQIVDQYTDFETKLKELEQTFPEEIERLKTMIENNKESLDKKIDTNKEQIVEAAMHVFGDIPDENNVWQMFNDLKTEFTKLKESIDLEAIEQARSNLDVLFEDKVLEENSSLKNLQKKVTSNESAIKKLDDMIKDISMIKEQMSDTMLPMEDIEELNELLDSSKDENQSDRSSISSLDWDMISKQVESGINQNQVYQYPQLTTPSPEPWEEENMSRPNTPMDVPRDSDISEDEQNDAMESNNQESYNEADSQKKKVNENEVTTPESNGQTTDEGSPETKKDQNVVNVVTPETKTPGSPVDLSESPPPETKTPGSSVDLSESPPPETKTPGSPASVTVVSPPPETKPLGSSESTHDVQPKPNDKIKEIKTAPDGGCFFHSISYFVLEKQKINDKGEVNGGDDVKQRIQEWITTNKQYVNTIKENSDRKSNDKNKKALKDIFNDENRLMRIIQSRNGSCGEFLNESYWGSNSFINLVAIVFNRHVVIFDENENKKDYTNESVTLSNPDTPILLKQYPNHFNIIQSEILEQRYRNDMVINRPKTFENSVTLTESDDETHNDNKGPQSQQDIKQGVDLAEERKRREQSSIDRRKINKKEQIQALRLNREMEEQRKRQQMEEQRQRLISLYSSDILIKNSIKNLIDNLKLDETLPLNDEYEKGKEIVEKFLSQSKINENDQKEVLEVFSRLNYLAQQKPLKDNFPSVHLNEVMETESFILTSTKKRRKEKNETEIKKKEVNKKKKEEMTREEYFDSLLKDVQTNEQYQQYLKRFDEYMHQHPDLEDMVGVKYQFILAIIILRILTKVNDDFVLDYVFPITNEEKDTNMEEDTDESSSSDSGSSSSDEDTESENESTEDEKRKKEDEMDTDKSDEENTDQPSFKLGYDDIKDLVKPVKGVLSNEFNEPNGKQIEAYNNRMFQILGTLGFQSHEQGYYDIIHRVFRGMDRGKTYESYKAPNWNQLLAEFKKDNKIGKKSKDQNKNVADFIEYIASLLIKYKVEGLKSLNILDVLFNTILSLDKFREIKVPVYLQEKPKKESKPNKGAKKVAKLNLNDIDVIKRKILEIRIQSQGDQTLNEVFTDNVFDDKLKEKSEIEYLLYFNDSKEMFTDFINHLNEKFEDKDFELKTKMVNMTYLYFVNEFQRLQPTLYNDIEKELYDVISKDQKLKSLYEYIQEKFDKKYTMAIFVAAILSIEYVSPSEYDDTKNEITAKPEALDTDKQWYLGEYEVGRDVVERLNKMLQEPNNVVSTEDIKEMKVFGKSKFLNFKAKEKTKLEAIYKSFYGKIDDSLIKGLNEYEIYYIFTQSCEKFNLAKAKDDDEKTKMFKTLFITLCFYKILSKKTELYLPPNTLNVTLIEYQEGKETVLRLSNSDDDMDDEESDDEMDDEELKLNDKIELLDDTMKYKLKQLLDKSIERASIIEGMEQQDIEKLKDIEKEMELNRVSSQKFLNSNYIEFSVKEFFFVMKNFFNQQNLYDPLLQFKLYPIKNNDKYIEHIYQVIMSMNLEPNQEKELDDDEITEIEKSSYVKNHVLENISPGEVKRRYKFLSEIIFMKKIDHETYESLVEDIVVDDE